MDPGETLVLFGIVTLCLLFVSSIMVSIRMGSFQLVTNCQ